MKSFPVNATTILISGECGELEVAVTASRVAIKPTQVAIICHPHPVYGGTMQNKVVTTLERTFIKLGMHSVRFNFRGVGQSAGQYADGVGELQDLFSVIDWVKNTYSNIELCLAGFSFGAYIAAKAANQMLVRQLVSVAPAVHHQDYTILTNINCPWIVVQGEQDEIVPAQQVFAWVNNHPKPPQLLKLPLASHFFSWAVS